MRPFIPFPIFPPYAHWRPNQEAQLPVNSEVNARLTALDSDFIPFMSTWYAHRYINWIAHNWNYQRPHQLYQNCTVTLEKMLNWSFANEISLLGWTRPDYERYADFIANPDASWAIPGNQARFIPNSPRLA